MNIHVCPNPPFTHRSRRRRHRRGAGAGHDGARATAARIRALDASRLDRADRADGPTRAAASAETRRRVGTDAAIDARDDAR